MGEVYRALDTRLDRTVAIKVLPSHLSSNSDLRARFEREAKAVSSLNHHHICTLHDVGHQDGTDYIVMELVEGETLLDRLKKGPLPLDQTLRYGIEIADALDKAHRHGVIHRDLKPGNVMLTKAGSKLMDFGLAKRALAGDGSGGVSALPTQEKPLTEAGSLLGTYQYMSPEQLEGKDADARADIWALGCVLYEMATGKRAFQGKSQASLISAIMTSEPQPISKLQPMTPPAFDRLVKTCLAKDSDERWQNAHDLAAELRWIAEEGIRASVRADEPSRRSAVARVAPWLLTLVAMATAAWALWMRSARDARDLSVQRLDVNLPADIEPRPDLSGGGFDLSPDGRIVAIVGVKNARRLVFVRRLDSDDVLEVSAEGGVNGVAFSPDGTRIAFLGGNGVVTSVSLVDRQRTLLASGADVTGSLAWGEAGVVFTRDGALWMAPAEGAEPHPLTVLDTSRHEVVHTRPIFLPGERTVLFSSHSTEPGTERIEAVSITGGHRSVVVDSATTPVWSPTGHLLFARDGAEFATAFDARAVRAQGAAIPVFPSGLVAMSQNGTLMLRIARNGTLLLAPQNFGDQRLVSVGRDGSALTLALPRGRYTNPRVSPDGRRVMVGRDFSHLEVLSLDRGTRSRLTTISGNAFSTWNRDGSRIVYRRFNMPFWMSADGRAQQGEIKGGVTNDFPVAPGPDADSVLVLRAQPAGDVFLLSLSASFEPRALIATRAYEGGPQLSPDGRWLVYVTNESGDFEIQVRRFPELDRHWPVSEGGGTQPRWSTNGREIYYRSSFALMAVPFDGRAEEPMLGKPVTLFEDEYDLGLGSTIANYDVTPEGRFLLLRSEVQGGHLRIVLNWTEELKGILASGGLR